MEKNSHIQSTDVLDQIWLSGSVLDVVQSWDAHA